MVSDHFRYSIIRQDLARATVREPEDVGVKTIAAALERDQSLLHKLLLTPAPVARRKGAYTVAFVVSVNRDSEIMSISRIRHADVSIASL